MSVFKPISHNILETVKDRAIAIDH